jgi:hypothetical protein
MMIRPGIMLATFSSASREVAPALRKRLEEADWKIVMRALLVLHRLLNEANTQFLPELTRGIPQSLHALSRFYDMGSSQGHTQSHFIRLYSQYLETKVPSFIHIDIFYCLVSSIQFFFFFCCCCCCC